MSDEQRRLPSFVRQKSRPLSARQKALVDNLLPKLSVSPKQGEQIDLNSLFPAPPIELTLEIGFGGGEHLIGQAKRSPNHQFIGVEPYLDGMAKALTAIAEEDITNIRLHRGDARDVIDALPDACLDRVFILFPDPWPKKRHQKRRLVQTEFVRDITRCLKIGAQLRFATDVESYLNSALCYLTQSTHLEWTAKCADDWRRQPSDHIKTRYQEKRLGDIEPVWLDFIRS